MRVKILTAHGVISNSPQSILLRIDIEYCRQSAKDKIVEVGYDSKPSTGEQLQ